ncbi:MAG: translocation/assembly module TamB domain-containing protein [Rhizobiaceae bacterium]|nr:translocation/assembly module TamB domain-containing protein [Rhizobiaceae bacterium]
MTWIGWLLARLFAVTGVLLVVAIVAFAILGYTTAGNQFLADQIASRVSTPDMQIRIEGARGLLAGRFRIERISVADTSGPFAEIDDLAIDWSPFSLLTAEFEADRIAAARIDIQRPPIQTVESEPSEGSFNLPVEIVIRKIELPSLSLGKDILGKAAEIALSGSAQGAADLLALTIDARQANQSGAHAVADLAYAVNARTLKLKLDVSEPKGGLLATMLKLPDDPAIRISVTGDGPLDSWTGQIRASLDGTERLALDGSHLRNEAGIHHVVLSGGGPLGTLLPPALRPLFEGESTVDIDASFASGGMLDIRSARLTNDSLSLDVSGAIDPAGQAKLNGSLRPAGDVLAFRWPMTEGMLEIDIRNAALTLSGPFRSAVFGLSADIARAALPAGRFDDILFRLDSDTFDLASKSGPLSLELTVESAEMANPQSARLVRGPIRIDAPITLDGSDLRADTVAISSGAFGGTATLSYNLDSTEFELDFKTFVVSRALLPPDLATKAGTTIALSGALSGTPDDLAIEKVTLASDIAVADLSGTLKNGAIDLSLDGRLPRLTAFQPDIAGAATLTAKLSGNLAAPSVLAEARAADVTLAGRTLQSLAVKLDALADPRAPKGTLTVTGAMDGQTIDINGDIVTSDQGLVSLPALKAVVGRNTLTASLALDTSFLPSGTIRFDLPDIGLLAALGGQKAEGDLKGEAVLDNAGGRISATVKAEGSGITSDGLSIRRPAIDLDIPDLATGQLSGKVAAEELAAGANRLAGLDVNFALAGPRTDIKVAGRYDDAPLTLEGAVLRRGDAIEINLDGLSAAPRKLPVALAEPAALRLENGAVDLGTISLLAAGARIDISGTVSERLNVQIDAPALPLELADLFSPGLDAAGALEAHATITGTTADPLATFTIDGRTLTARPLREAGRDPLDIRANGRFEKGKLSITSDIAGIRELGPSTLAADVALRDGAVHVDTLTLNAKPLIVRGDAVLKDERLALSLSGELPNLTAFLPQAEGRATFAVSADGPLSALPVKARLETKNAVMAGKTLESLVVEAMTIVDPAKPSAKITATGRIDGQTIDANADLVSEQGRIALPVIKANVGRNSIAGAIALTAKNLPTGALTFDLPDIGLLAALAGQKAAGQLTGSIDLAEADGKVSATVKARGDGVTAQGVRISKPDVDIRIPDLLAGQIGGTVRAADVVSGANRLSGLDARFTRADTATDFEVKGRYDGAPLVVAGALETRPEGLAVTLRDFSASPKRIPVRLSAPVTITTGGDGARIEKLRIATGKGSITVDGTAGDRLDLKIKVASLPASLANTFASGLDASGTIGADATVTGSTANPLVVFTVNWQQAMTSQIRAAGIPALTVKAKGRLEGTRLSIDTNVRGGGLTLDADGTVETGGSQSLNLSVKGKLPFAAIESQLAAQGLALKGNASFDLKIGGNASKPDISGRITTANGQFIAIRQNLVVNNLAATITLSGQTATISSLSGKLDGGGKVSASGTVGFAPGSGLPADLAIKLDRAVYADGRVVVAKVSGDLTVRGPLQREATLGGTIRLRRADITVPERLPASLANANVKHRNAPADVTRQSRDIRSDSAATADESKGGGLRLDLKIVAPRQIFVRGRGLDAELGGQVQIAGLSSAPNVSGGFKMLRGRLSIVGKRLDFTTGEITFGGGLVPYLNMIASTTVNATTLNVNVSGLANDPSFSFTSSPVLPQDEVLAQLIFGRESSKLSPFQIAQLADAVATLSGGQRTSLFNKLRQGLGVDDLNVGTDENGGAQVTAGKYLNRRTYLELKQGEDESKSGVAINLDIGKGVKLRGEATADGNTSTGIFYEKEY